MYANKPIAAAAVFAAICLIRTTGTEAGFDARPVHRHADRVLHANRDFRREVQDLPLAQRLALFDLSSQVQQRTSQIAFAVRVRDFRLAELRARQLAETINRLQRIVSLLPRHGSDVFEVRREYRHLEIHARDLIRSLG